MFAAEKALMSLPSPLTASDEWIKPRETTVEIVRVTAGLHRQVWVSGTSLYVDVHVANNSRKLVKKIELQLERDILCYKHVCYASLIYYLVKMLMRVLCRLLQLRWRSLRVRLASLTATSGLSSVKQSSSMVVPAGTVFLHNRLISGPVISEYPVATVR